MIYFISLLQKRQSEQAWKKDQDGEVKEKQETCQGANISMLNINRIYPLLHDIVLLCPTEDLQEKAKKGKESGRQQQ